MPTNTAGGWPYPLPTEPTRDGAVNMQALADQAQKRLAEWSLVPVATVALFNVNGLVYIAWSDLLPAGQTWATVPTIVAGVGQTTTAGDAGVGVQVYQPHNTVTTLVLQANYLKDGRVFTGNINLFALASGRKS
jgi:hypothetical protein